MNSCVENVLSCSNRRPLTLPPAAPAPAGPMRVWLVDDDARIRDLLAALISQAEDMDCSRIFPSAAAVLSALSRESAPEVLLVDLHLGADDGISLVKKIHALAPRARVFIVSTFYDSFEAGRALQAGALGYLVKSNVERLLERLRATQPQSRPASLPPHAAAAA